jgi:hypothetical protein
MWQTGRALAACWMLGAGDVERRGPFDVPCSPEISRPLFLGAGELDDRTRWGIQPEMHHLGRRVHRGLPAASPHGVMP